MAPIFFPEGNGTLLLKRSSAVTVEIHASLDFVTSESSSGRFNELLPVFSLSFCSWDFDLGKAVQEYVIREILLAVINTSKGMKFRFLTMDDW